MRLVCVVDIARFAFVSVVAFVAFIAFVAFGDGLLRDRLPCCPFFLAVLFVLAVGRCPCLPLFSLSPF